MEDQDLPAIVRRLDAMERNQSQLASSHAILVDNIGKGFTEQQLGQIRHAFRDELADAGLRLDDAGHQDEAREDFRFLRGLRPMRDSMSAKIGNAVITDFIVICFDIIGTGFWQWNNSGGK
jgi:hypothetical protein